MPVDRAHRSGTEVLIKVDRQQRRQRWKSPSLEGPPYGKGSPNAYISDQTPPNINMPGKVVGKCQHDKGRTKSTRIHGDECWQ